MKSETNKKLWAIHNWVGLYVGLVIAILSVTGAFAVFIPEIDKLVHPDLLTVQPKAEKVSLDSTFLSLQHAYPDYTFNSLELPQEENETWLFSFAKPSEAGGSERVQIPVNPYDGKELGEQNIPNSLAFFMRQLHVRLYVSSYGRQIVGLAGIALLISTITGFLIYGNFMKRQMFATIRRGKNLRIATADWHKAVGVSSLLFNFMIAGTGAWLGLQPVIMDWLDMRPPNTYQVESKPFSVEVDKALPLSFEKVLQRVNSEFPELAAERISPSKDGSGTITVVGNIPGTVYERESSKLVLSKEHYLLKYKFDPRAASTGDQFYYIQEPLHFGDFGGLLLKFIYFVFGLTASALSITGFYIFLKRKESKRLKKGGKSTAKIMVKYIAVVALSIILICILSLNISYSFAATVVNATVYILLLFLLLRLIYQKLLKNEKT